MVRNESNRYAPLSLYENNRKALSYLLHFLFCYRQYCMKTIQGVLTLSEMLGLQTNISCLCVER